MNDNNKIGSIYFDKRINRYRCTYYTLDNESLVEIRKTKSFISEQEAKDFLTTIQCQKGNELYLKNNGIPLNLLMRGNAQKKREMNLIEERQYSRILDTITAIEKAPSMQKNIDEISSQEIQDYLNTLTKYSESTINKIYEQFKQNYKYAHEKGYIVKNPLVDVIKPKSLKPTKQVRALEIDEQEKFTNYLMTIPKEIEPYKLVYLIEMYAGLRIGEVLALRNSDIDLNKDLISVNKTLTTDREHKIIMGKTTKSKAGIREIPIPEFIKNDIIAQMKSAENNKDQQLFVNTKGEYVNPRIVNRALQRTLKNMGITDISTHSLRHTYGTRCIEAGMRDVALQRLMGHSDITVTLNTYTSVFNKYKEEELQKVNDYYLKNGLFRNKNNLHIIKNNNDLEEQEIV